MTKSLIIIQILEFAKHYIFYIERKFVHIAQFTRTITTLKPIQTTMLQNTCITLRSQITYILYLFSICRTVLSLLNIRQFVLNTIATIWLRITIFQIHKAKLKQKNDSIITIAHSTHHKLLSYILLWTPCILSAITEKKSISIFALSIQYSIYSYFLEMNIRYSATFTIILFALKIDIMHSAIEWLAVIIVMYLVWRKYLLKYITSSIECSHHLKSQNMFRSIVDSIDDPIFIINNSLKLSYQNEVCISQFGMEAYFFERCLKSFRSESNYAYTLFDVINDFVYKKINNTTDIFSIITVHEKKYFRPIIFKVDFKSKICIRLQDYTQSNNLSIMKVVEKSQKMMINSISHEMRNPLNSIIGPLENTLESSNLPYIKENMLVAYISSLVLQSKVEDFIDYSSIISNKFSLNKQRFSLKEMLKYLSQICVRYISPEITLKFNVQKNITENISHDRKRLQQILIKLLLNSIKFTKKGGIELCIRKCCDSLIKFEVNDTGCGIEANLLNHIRRGCEAKPGEEPSQLSGIGLSTVQMILKEMSSELIVYSELGKGTSFSFSINSKGLERKRSALSNSNGSNKSKYLGSVASLEQLGEKFFTEVHDSDIKINLLDTLTDDFIFPPLRHPGILAFKSEQEFDQIPDEFNALNKPESTKFFDTHRIKKISNSMKSYNWSIFIVDDNKMNRIVLYSYLKDLQNVQIKEFINGKEILDCMMNRLVHNGKTKPAKMTLDRYLIFMDINMPVMDGIEATKSILSLEGAMSAVIIIAVTAFAENWAKEQCMNVGIKAIINKPVAKRDFIGLVKSYIENHIV